MGCFVIFGYFVVGYCVDCVVFVDCVDVVELDVVLIEMVIIFVWVFSCGVVVWIMIWVVEDVLLFLVVWIIVLLLIMVVGLLVVVGM